MTGSIRILCPERGTERVDFRKSHCRQLPFQLTAYGEIGGSSEKIIFKIHFAMFISRRCLQWQRGHFKHFPRSFCIRCGDNRCMQIDESPFIKKLVYGKSKRMPKAEHRSECVRPEPQMGYFP